MTAENPSKPWMRRTSSGGVAIRTDDPDDTHGSSVDAGEDVVVLMPVFNDWQACEKVLVDLDRILADHDLTAGVLIVDDASTVPGEPPAPDEQFYSLNWIKTLRLRRNLGHQRAICIGLSYVEANLDCGLVAVMDCDGEDSPADVPRLLEACEQHRREQVVFAERTKRSESWLFRWFYAFYQLLYRLLTGHTVRIGNFSVIPRSRLGSLVTLSDLWNHYAAAVLHSRQLICTVKTARARRVAGQSKMNFVGLVIHGLSAIAVFGDVVGVRVLIGATFTALLSGLGFVGLFAFLAISRVSIPAWVIILASLWLLGLTLIVVQATSFTLATLRTRKNVDFIPGRDYGAFVDDVKTLCERE